MIGATAFDDVHGCQQAFRLILKAISYPGETVELSPFLEGIDEYKPAFFLMALTLMDKETSFSVIGDEALSETIKQYTYASAAGADKADFLFVPGLCPEEAIRDIVGRVKPGTLVEPHTSCVLIVGDNAPAESSRVITGPGVDGERAVHLSDYALRWLKSRDEMAFEYPTGLDMYFLSDGGSLLAIPRKMKTEER